MSLKLSDAFKLSWTNISTHKVRSALVIIAISAFFTLILGFSLIFRGVEQTVLSAATAGSQGRTYLETGFIPAFESAKVDSSLLPAHADQTIEQLLSRYHGTKVGHLTLYKFDHIKVEHAGTPNRLVHYTPDWYEVIDASAVTAFLTTDLANVPSSQIPVILPRGKSLTEAQAQTFTVVGEFPLSQSVNLRLPGEFNPLNLVLGSAHGRTDSALLNNYLIVNDGRTSIQDFLTARTDQMNQEATAADTFSNPSLQVYTVAAFDRAEDAAEYYLDMPKHGKEFGYTCNYAQTYLCQTTDLFGNAVSVAASFYSFNFVMLLFGALLLVIAACIATITLTHIISEDVATIALYRSLGATTKDICLIYLLYLLELCFAAIIFCFISALLCAGIMTAVNAHTLSTVLQNSYYLSEPPTVSLLSFSPQFFLVLLSIFLIAPLSLLLAANNFSPKAIAKKLKAS